MTNLIKRIFDKKQKPETKTKLSLDDLKFIVRNTQDINLKDKAEEMLVNENIKNNDFYNLSCIMSDNNYSLKTQNLAGGEYIKYLSMPDSKKKDILLEISHCNGHTKENREKAGVKYIDGCISDGCYSKLAEISKNSSYPSEVRDYATNNFNSAFENYINEQIERIKQGNFTFLLYFGKENIPDNLRTKVEEMVKRSVEAKLKSGCKDIEPCYFFNLVKTKNLSESFKSWAKKQGIEITREDVNERYSKGDYSALVNYSVCGWSQEIQELSKKKLEELVVEMGKRL